jgi:hypothetical protein
MHEVGGLAAFSLSLTRSEHGSGVELIETGITKRRKFRTAMAGKMHDSHAPEGSIRCELDPG